MLRLAISLCLLAVGALGWVNDWDKPFKFQCDANKFLSHINSVHDNHREDRRWDFECSPLPLSEVTVQNCHWTNYVNEYDQPETFQCPYEQFIAGIGSEHHNHYEDRLFKFYCCEAPGTMLHACYYTDWANDWDRILDFVVPSNKVLRGINSYHDNHREDRRFKFEVCEMVRV